jgi:hypothetical protein
MRNIYPVITSVGSTPASVLAVTIKCLRQSPRSPWAVEALPRRTSVALRRHASAVVRDPSLQTYRCSGAGMQYAADLADPLVDVRDVVESFRSSHLTLPDWDEILHQPREGVSKDPRTKALPLG